MGACNPDRYLSRGCEAQSGLTDARSCSDPQRRRELARSAVRKARQVARHRDVTDEERAAARQVTGHGRMLATTEARSPVQARRATVLAALLDVPIDELGRDRGEAQAEVDGASDRSLNRAADQHDVFGRLHRERAHANGATV